MPGKLNPTPGIGVAYNCSIIHGISRPITSSTMVHMANVPDMAILRPVQTTTMVASPRHSVLPALRIVGPFVARMSSRTVSRNPFEVIAVFDRNVGRDTRIDL